VSRGLQNRSDSGAFEISKRNLDSGTKSLSLEKQEGKSETAGSH
jgi:hypothetical protein